MKITSLPIGACLLLVLTGCHKPQTGETIGAAEAAIKTAALTSILAKHSEVSSADLKFSNIEIRALSDGKEEIFVTYDLAASAKTTTEGKKTTITKKTIGVRVSLSGKAESVYDSTTSDTYNTTQ